MQDLPERVFDHLIDVGVHDDVIDLVLAAIQGEATLSAVLADEVEPLRPEPLATRTPPARAFLTELSVRGFRGIGAEAKLILKPGPGLTIVAGRNGSGKSSLSDALECALTGTTARWDRKLANPDFRSAWRNLHRPDPCSIEVSLDQLGRGRATIAVTWPKDAPDSGAARVTYQVAGEKRQEQADALGWKAALQTYRPMLSYDDLGQLLTARPSELHDMVARGL